MRLTLQATLFLQFLVLVASAHDEHAPHPNDALKHAEHMAALVLVKDDTAIEATGSSSDLTFAPDSDLYVPEGAEFVIDGDFECRRIKFDGTLLVTTNACTIRFETLIGTECGTLIIPASANLRTIRLKARGPRDRHGDPTDVAGGIILHSTENQMLGDEKTSLAVPARIDASNNRLEFAAPVKNWQTGDRILIPGVTSEMSDELVSVVSVSADQLSVQVTDVAATHALPDGSYPAVGNMNRSLVFESEDPAIDQRGHFMIMHEHSGTTIAYAAFRFMGRTSVESTPTKIKQGPDGEFISGDANTIGRYPIHFHGRNGADPSATPHEVIGCVVENAPSHGLVNHGSHVSARDNVIYDCGGSNLFGENGLELGDFTNNLCVLSRGRQAPVTPAQRNADFAANNFGWEGTTLWLQGPGIDVVGNHLYRAKRALIAADYTALPDAGGQFDYPVSYMREGPQKLAVQEGRFGHSTVTTGFHQVPSYYEGNRGAGAVIGMEMTHSMYDTRSSGDGAISTRFYAERTKLHGCRFFNVDTGFDGTYIGHLDVRDCRLDGNLELADWWRPYHGTFAGTKVHDVAFTNCEFRRFQVGIVDRGWSDFDVDGCTFENNLIDVQVICRSTISAPHEVRISNCRHLGRPAMAAAYKRKNPKTVWGKPRDYWFHDQFPERASKFDANVFRVAPHTLNGHLLYYPSNADSFVPFDGTGTEYDGLNNLQLSQQKNVSVMGRSFDPRSAAYERLAIDANIPIIVEKAGSRPRSAP